MRSFTTALILSFTGLGLAAKSTSDAVVDLQEVDELPTLDISRFIDVLSLRSTYNGPLEFNELTRGEVDYTQSKFFSFLGLVGGEDSEFTWAPSLNYRYSNLAVDTFNTFPGFDDSLHELTFMSFGICSRNNSRWLHGFFSNFGLRSDFGSIDSRDFFLAGAIGSGYQFNERFTLGFGVYASDITNDLFIMPALVFFWMPTEDWLVSYYGPKFIARREFGPNTRIGFEAAWNGGSWNIDSRDPLQDSLRVDLSSIRAGFYLKQRLAGELWGEIGAGYTFGNELELRSPGGRDLYPNAYGAMDGAPYINIGLSLNRW